MKKIVGLVGLLFFVCIEKSFSFDSQDVWRQWRSSETCTADTDVNIATGVIFLKEVLTTSGTAGIGQFQYFNSSAAVAAGVTRATSTIFQVDTAGRHSYEIHETLTRGLQYTKTGTSCVKIKWDWYIEPQPGQASRGLKD